MSAVFIILAILLTVWSLTSWLIFIIDWHQRLQPKPKTLSTILAICMWIIWANL